KEREREIKKERDCRGCGCGGGWAQS
ncbi:hypothetical protein BpHYR1_033465, partial [Brachionus plicatilis]